MAFSFNVSKAILALFLSSLTLDMLMINSAQSFLAKADLIDDICSQTTIDPEFCKTALRSDPRSSKADLPTLAQIAIDLAQSNTKSTITLVKSLDENATDPTLKGVYDTCLETYGISTKSLDDCVEALKAKDYSSLNIRASAAKDGPSTCDGSFSELSLPEPPELQTSSNHIQELGSVILKISKKLSGTM